MRIGRLLSFVFIFAVAGGHWGVLQVAAWASMALNSESGSLIDTVLGEPCEICISISQGSQEEKNDPKSVRNLKLDAFALDERGGVRLCQPPVICELDDAPPALSGIRLAPPHGPPRYS